MNRLKNFLIVLLIVSTVIQTNILWLQNISRHNFFYKENDEQTPIDNYIAENFKLEIKNENGYFAIIYKPDEKIKNVTDGVLKEIFQNGKLISKTNFDIESEIQKSTCVYDYDFFIDTDSFSKYLGLKSNSISKFKTFNKIFFEGKNIIAFADTLEKKLYRFQSENDFDFENLAREQNYVYDKNLSPVENLYLPNVKINNPYEKNGDLLMNTIDEKLDCFFENTTNKNVENVNNILVFSSNANIVKYYPENILEYASYQTGNKNSDLDSDYAAAISFIKKDECTTNDVILKSYRQSDSQSEFYFDYLINNLPIEIENEPSIQNLLSVTVKNGTVAKYKKLAFNFISTQDFSAGKFKKYVYVGQNDFLSLH